MGLIDEVRMSSVARPANAMQLMTLIPLCSRKIGDTLAVGQPASLSVTAAGAPQLTYQWRLDGSPLEGATQNVYSIGAAQFTNAGSYDVVITNSQFGHQRRCHIERPYTRESHLGRLHGLGHRQRQLGHERRYGG